MKQNKARTVVTIIGVILATAMVTAVITFGTSIQRYMYDHAVETDGDWHIAAKGISEEQAATYAADKEVKETAGISELGYANLDKEGSAAGNYLYIQTMNEKAADMLKVRVSEGRLPEKDNEIILYSSITEADGSEKGIGDEIELMVGDRLAGQGILLSNAPLQYDDNGNVAEQFRMRFQKTYKIVGYLDHWGDTEGSGGGNDAFVGEGGQEQSVKNVYMKLNNPKNAFAFAKEHGGEAYFDVNSGVLKWIGISGNEAFAGMLAGMFAILITIIGVGAVSLIYNAFSISLRERTTQFGLLSSIGATKKQLRQAMWQEAFTVSAIGIPLGLLSGIGGIGVTLGFIGRSLAQWIHGETDGKIAFHTSWQGIVLAVLLAVLIIWISVWIPAARIKRITPIEAIRANKDIKIRAKEVKTPKIIGKLFGLNGILADKNYKRDRKKYRATVFSLTVSIVLFTSATLFSNYLSMTGAFMLEAPEYEFEYQLGPTEASAKQKEELQKLLESGKKVTRVKTYGDSYMGLEFNQPDLSEWMRENSLGYTWEEYSNFGIYGDAEGTEQEGEKAEKQYYYADVIVLPDDAFAEFAKEQGIQPEPYMKRGGEEVLYYDSYQYFDSDGQKYKKVNTLGEERKEGIKGAVLTNDTLRENGDGNKTEEEIFASRKEIIMKERVNELPDYVEEGYSICKIFIPESRKTEFLLQPNDQPTEYFKVKSSSYKESYEDLRQKLENGKSEIMIPDRLQNLAQRYDQDRGILIAIRVLSYGFIILISLIAAANVFNTISTNVMIRKREFAMLRSMGMDEKNLKKMTNYECLIYGIRSIVYGVVLSLLISLAMFLVLARGAEIEYKQPWGGLAAAVIWVFAVVFITMFYSMRKIKKQNIVEELKKD